MSNIFTDVERVPVENLKPHPRNPRRGNVAAIKESLEHNGQFRPIVANRANSVIIAGHHLWLAARELEWPEVSVLWVDATETKHVEMMLADNRTSDLGTYDNTELEALIAGLLEETQSLAGTGYTEGDLARLFGRGVTEYGVDPDDVPVVKGKAKSKPGQIWILGPHRLAVGDATDRDLMGRLMAGEQADAMWTDPPYGVNYVGGTKDALTIQNDDAVGLAALLVSSFAVARSFLRPGAPCYICHADTERMTFEQALIDTEFLVRQNLIWVKNSLVLGRSDYHYRHEPILEAQVAVEADPDPDSIVDHEPVLYGFAPGGKGRLGRGGERWFGNNSGSTVFIVDKPRASAEHPTMKPVDLIVQMLNNSAPPGGLVLDMFAGSGSTLVAADSLGLRANVVELDPHYADVICARYENLTGTKPVKE